MEYSFRKTHLLRIVENYKPGLLPIDSCLRDYFRKHHALGSKDRKFITEKIYEMIRFRDLIDHFTERGSWEERLALIERGVYDVQKAGAHLPPYLRLSMPKPLFTLLANQYGEKKAIELCEELNREAPITIRVNPLKISRDALMELWYGFFPMEKTERSPLGIKIGKRAPLLQTEEYRKGYFEIQDEGSQLLALLVDAKKGMNILDFCAGSGGKSLALAPQMQGTGQLYLHDIRQSSLKNAKQRLARASIQNVQFLLADEKKKWARLEGKMDRVLLDVPCTGTGTLRRNPDMKWRFTNTLLEETTSLQREIVAKAVTYLKPGGKLIYTTCSLLQQENQDQIAFFEKAHNLVRLQPDFFTLPTSGGPDGFFGAVLGTISNKSEHLLASDQMNLGGL